MFDPYNIISCWCCISLPNGLRDLTFKLLKTTYALETIIFAVLLIYQLFNIDNLHKKHGVRPMISMCRLLDRVPRGKKIIIIIIKKNKQTKKQKKKNNDVFSAFKCPFIMWWFQYGHDRELFSHNIYALIFARNTNIITFNLDFIEDINVPATRESAATRQEIKKLHVL